MFLEAEYAENRPELAVVSAGDSELPVGTVEQFVGGDLRVSIAQPPWNDARTQVRLALVR